MNEHDDSAERAHWGCVAAFVVPVAATIGFLVWLFDRLTGWSVLPR